jgi:hypothetical protein
MYLDFRVAASLALAVADHTAFLGADSSILWMQNRRCR